MKAFYKAVCAILAAPALFISACESASSPNAQGPEATVAATFERDILPILQQRCQGCHRPEGLAPMALMTHADARPWAEAIAALTGSENRFSGHPGPDMSIPPLDEASVKAIADWARSGAP